MFYANYRTTNHSKMQDSMVELLVQKLICSIREVDIHTQDKVLAEWSLISPSPQCPFINDLMNKIHLALVAGCNEKERIAKDIVSSILKPFRTYLTSELAQEIMAKVNSLFPENSLLSLVEKTPDVYNRRNAPNNKFDQSAYALQLSLITVSAINIARQSVDNIQTVIEEMLILEAITKPVKKIWWKSLLKIGLKFTASIAKWILTIFTAVIIAIIIYAFGIK